MLVNEWCCKHEKRYTLRKNTASHAMLMLTRPIYGKVMGALPDRIRCIASKTRITNNEWTIFYILGFG